MKCRVFACNTCAHFGEHKGHDVNDIKKALETLK